MTGSLTFEALLADVVSELVSVCLDYAGPSVSDVFVYASLEGGLSVNPFFALGTDVVRKHKVPGIDVSGGRQDAMLQYGIDQLQRLVREAPAFGATIPTEIKLHYTVAMGGPEAEFKATPQWSTTPGLDKYTLADEWLSRVQDALAKGEPAPM